MHESQYEGDDVPYVFALAITIIMVVVLSLAAHSLYSAVEAYFFTGTEQAIQSTSTETK